MNITIPDLNITNQTSIIANWTNLSQGAFYPAQYMWGQMQDIVIGLIIVLTVGLAYIKSDTSGSMAYVVLLFAGILGYLAVLGYGLSMKIAYLIAIMAVAGLLYAVFGKR